MPLFTDGNPADIEYLRSYESGILDVAETEGIDLDAKLTLGAEEIGNTLLAFITRQGSPDVQLRRRQVGLTAVVATPALRRWHATRTLALIYRDAFGSQLNERYESKAAEYITVSKQTEDELFQIGVGMVNGPVAKAGAPTIGASGAGADTFYIRVSWLDQAGNEGTASDVIAAQLSPGTAIFAPSTKDSRLVNWNVYLGSSGDSTTLQNGAPLATGSSWAYPGSLVQGAATPGTGQIPDFFLVDHHTTLRG
jgi:hypothetical protein